MKWFLCLEWPDYVMAFIRGYFLYSRKHNTLPAITIHQCKQPADALQFFV